MDVTNESTVTFPKRVLFGNIKKIYILWQDGRGCRAWKNNPWSDNFADSFQQICRSDLTNNILDVHVIHIFVDKSI